MPRVANIKELEIADLKWLKRNKLRKLLCDEWTKKVMKFFELLPTAPFCPKLQPIETFWAAGKSSRQFIQYGHV